MAKKVTPDSEFEAMGAVPADDAEFEALGAVPVESEVVPGEPISPSESALKGAQQGLLLGGADELQGAIPAGLDVTQRVLASLGLTGLSPSQVNTKLASQGVKGNLGPQTLLDQYREGRNASRKDFAAAEAANPGFYMGGNIAGGALTAMAAPQALMNPMGSAPASAPLLQKIAQGAVNAIPASAAVGAGMSTAELTPDQITPESAMNFGSDVLKDAGMGAAIGGAIPLVAAPLKAAGGAIADSKIGQDMGEAYRAGKDKIDLSLPDTLKEYRDLLLSKAGSVDSSIRKADKNTLDQRKMVIEGLNPDQKTNVKDIVQKFADEVNSGALLPDERTMVNEQLAKIMAGGYDRSPQELDYVLKQIKDILGNSKAGSATFNAAKTAQSSLRKAQDVLDPRLQGLNQKAGQITELGETLTKNSPLEFAGAAKDTRTDEMLANLLERPESDYRTQSYLDKVINQGLETSNGNKIAPLKELVPEAAETIESAAPIAKRLDLAKRMQNVSTKIGGPGGIEKVGNAITTAGPKAANAAGRMVQENQEFLQNGIKQLADASPEQLKGLATKMATAGGTAGKEFASVLAQAEGKNNISKNAIMFGLMQKPEFRKLYHELNQEQSDVPVK